MNPKQVGRPRARPPPAGRRFCISALLGVHFLSIPISRAAAASRKNGPIDALSSSLLALWSLWGAAVWVLEGGEAGKLQQVRARSGVPAGRLQIRFV